MSFSSKIVRHYLASKCGSQQADALLDEAADLRKGPRPQLTATDLKTVLANLPNARVCIAYGLAPLRLPDAAAGRKGLAIVFNPSVRADKQIMDELARHGAWDLIDLY